MRLHLPSLIALLALGSPDAWANHIAREDLAWDQELRADAPGETPQKSVLWNLAVSQPLWGGRVVPTFDALGTSIVDASAGRDEDTRLDLAAGLLVRPFPDDHWAARSP